MAAIHLIGEDTFTNANQANLAALGISISPTGIPLKLVRSPSRHLIVRKGEVNEIQFCETAHIIRGILRWIQMPSNGQSTEIIRFRRVGPMIDLSRNGVLTVQGIKRLLLKCARLGLNTCTLYMEDLYEVPNYPYFGYLRGRYSIDALKDLDDFAAQLGIELIPAIQTLGHLGNPLKWGFTNNFRDTADILLVDEPATYQFLESLIRSIRQAFRTNKIHLGMDEAWALGSGVYLKKHGYHEQFEIMKRHLQQVVAIAIKYQFSPMIWSDMFFDAKSKSGSYYDSEVEFDSTDASAVPPEIELTYWDYYHFDKATYTQMLIKHNTLSKQTSFAGGIWMWNSFAPNYGHTIVCTKAGLTACIQQGIQDVYATIWGDDGQETSIEAADFGLVLYANYQFSAHPSLEETKADCQTFLQENADWYLTLQLFDEIPGISKNNLGAENPCKSLLYEDLFLSMVDENLKHSDLEAHYQKLADALAAINSTHVIWKFYRQLARVLAIKAPLASSIRQYYSEKNSAAMMETLNRLNLLTIELQQLKHVHHELWSYDYKPFGWEVFDIRYGGMISRLHTIVGTLEQWVAHPGVKIPELEEHLLPFNLGANFQNDVLSNTSYSRIVTPSKLSGN